MPANYAYPRSITERIDRSLLFLFKKQLPSGEFETLRIKASDNKDIYFESSPFTTSQIAYSLSFATGSVSKEMIEKSIAFLIKEMIGPGLWKFRTSKAGGYKEIPMDLDDTACISFVLRQQGVRVRNEGFLAKQTNRKGLYHTWISPSMSLLFYSPICWLTTMIEHRERNNFWKITESNADDVDAGVNANVLWHLGETRKNKVVIEYLTSVVENGREEDSDNYYLSKFPVYYFISRAYYHGVKSLGATKAKIISTLQEIILLGAISSNHLELALSACTLLNFSDHSPALEKAIEQICEGQESDGGWTRFKYYYSGPGKHYNWGSRELTTGLCLEALLRFSLL